MAIIDFLEFADRDYVEQKIAACLKKKGSEYASMGIGLEHLAAQVQPLGTDLPLADVEAERAKLSDARWSQLQEQMQRATALIDAQFPLLDGEVVEEDRFTFLTADHGGHKAGTPLLVRTTNKATMVHFLTRARFDRGHIVIGEPPLEPRVATPAPVLGDGMDLVKSLFSGLAKGVGSEIGAAIFSAIFPSSGGDLQKLLQQLQDNIRQIFREELDAKTVDDLKFQLAGITSYMQQTYLPQKEAGRDRNYLEKLLLDQNALMYDSVMALLLGDRYRARGIAYLVLGASAHLSIIQELAQVDNSADPEHSAYARTYRLRMNEYIDGLEHATAEVYSHRLTYLSGLKESTLRGAATDRWWFVDSWAHYESPHFGNTADCCDYKIDARNKAQKHRDLYYEQTFHPQIVTDLTPYYDTRSKWAEILTRGGPSARR